MGEDETSLEVLFYACRAGIVFFSSTTGTLCVTVALHLELESRCPRSFKESVDRRAVYSTRREMPSRRRVIV